MGRSRCALLLIALFLIPLGSALASEPEPIELTIWHTFASESREEATFLAAIADFEASNPDIEVDVTMVPFANADQLFLTAAQGGEAPDLIRLSNDQLGKMGDVRVDGFPLLEDLRPHLTPAEAAAYDPRGLDAMHYGDALYGLPASQDCLSLIWNRALFDAAGEAYPRDDWTSAEMLQAAQNLTHGEVNGLALPVKVAYWWFPFQTGWGGELFDAAGAPSLDSNGSAAAMDWLFALEQTHGVVATGTQIDGMKSQFLQSEAAMIVDGPWNWATYEASRLDLSQSMLPFGPDGDRMSPLVTYKGWAVSKSATHKVAAVNLALHLTSEDVARDFALETSTLPTRVDLASDAALLADPVLAGFLAQAEVATPAPTTRGMSLVYGPLATAIEQVHGGVADSTTALAGANTELASLMADNPPLPTPPLTEGYRTAMVTLPGDASAIAYELRMDGVRHSTHPASGGGGNWTVNMTGLIPGVEHQVSLWATHAGGASILIWTGNVSTNVAAPLPPPADTSPILFALGAITISMFAAGFGLRALDANRRRRSGRALLHIAPAMLALAILTFYPVAYGIWLAFTDADQTHLGEQTWVGITNFLTVFTTAGFLRVTLFTLIWTVANVSAHIGLGLGLALILQRPLKGKRVYRTLLLLPWAVPSYISVLIWRGMLQPDGLVNLMLGTEFDLLADPTGAKFWVILVNIWLGVPFMMMSLSGALQALPGEMYEAAEVDGIGPWGRFVHLTLPNLKSALVPLSLLGFIWTFNMFNVIYLLTDGGPDLRFGEPGETDILITYVYDIAFRDGAYGVAAAWSVIIFLMLVGFSWYHMRRTNALEGSA